MQTAEHLLDTARTIIAQVTWCFMITAGESGELNARLVQIGLPQQDWTVRCMTDRRSRKVAEMERTGRLTLAYQHDPDRAYVTLLGRPTIIHDVEAKRAVWKPETYRFHPGGPDDPDTVLVQLTTDRIELCSGTHGIAPPPRGFSAATLTRTDQGWIVGATFQA